MVCFLASSGLVFEDMADALVLAAARPDPTGRARLGAAAPCRRAGRRAPHRCLPPAPGRAAAGDEAAALASVLEDEEFETFADVRCHRLFELGDRDGDGRLAFKDLVRWPGRGWGGGEGGGEGCCCWGCCWGGGGAWGGRGRWGLGRWVCKGPLWCKEEVQGGGAGEEVQVSASSRAQRPA